MEKKKEELLEELKDIKTKAEYDLKNNHPGYENCIVKNVIHYNKKVELINRNTKEKEMFDLCVAIVEDPDTNKTRSMYYLDGEEIDFTELMIEYESPEPIKDVVDKTRENIEKPEEEQDEELKKEELNDLETEKENEEKTKSTSEQSRRIGDKVEHIIQTIDVDKAYIDNWTTVSKGFGLPPQVKQIAIAYPNKDDNRLLASNITMYMLDNRGNVIQDINVNDFFEIDDSTGSNPMYDDNTKLELEEYAEKNESQTMRRFKSKQAHDLYLSAEQKKVGDYVEVYAGRRTRDGNDPVEVQLETNNVEIQTSFEMQKIISGYKGIYNKEEIDKEVDKHEKHGDDSSEIAIKNADGEKSTIKVCDYEIVPGTDKTWKKWADELGENEEVLKDRFEREVNKNSGRDFSSIVEEIENDYEMLQEHNRNETN